MFELKPLSPEGIDRALAKAEHYRLLNEPEEAESICLDILRLSPDHRKATIVLVLALTDQIGHRHSHAFQEALAAIPRLESAYDRHYYSGLAWERRAKARMGEGGPGVRPVVYEWTRRAMDYFEEAERLREHGNDDALLRWNACVRFLAAHPEAAPAHGEEDREPMMLE